MPTAAPSIVRYRCETFPFLKVRIGSEPLGDTELIHYAEFFAGVLDLQTDDPQYAQTVAALEKARNGGTPIALIGDPSEDEDVLGKLACKEFRCGHISRNDKAADAHRAMHARQAAVAAQAPTDTEDE